MTYIDILENQNITKKMINEAIKNNNYNSDYIFHASKLIKHPQKSGSKCLEVHLKRATNSDPLDDLYLILSDHDIIRTEKISLDYDDIKSVNYAPLKTIYHNNEMEAVNSDTLFSHIVDSLTHTMIKYHGKKYLKESIKQRQRFLSALKAANKYAKKKQDYYYEIPFENSMTQSDYTQIREKLLTTINITETLDEAILYESNMLKNMEKELLTLEKKQSDISGEQMCL